MNLEFKEITPGNWKEVNSLEVKEEQKKFVADNVAILAKAFVYREDNSKAHIICVREKPIGLIMQRDFLSNGRTKCILDQVMIDKNYQGQGYGKLAMETWIAMVKKEGIYSSIELCYIAGDFIAEKMYKSLGFVRKPEEDDEDELVMSYKL